MGGESPAFRRAVEHLDQVIAQAAQSGNRRLSTFRTLAAQASVSPPVMWRAVGEMKKQGVLDARPRVGITLKDAARRDRKQDPADVVAGRSGPKWQWLLDRIRTDLTAGQYRAASVLPTPKELCARYGVAHKTLRKALDSLVTERALVPFHRSYRMASTPAASRADTVVLIAFGEAGTELSLIWEADAERFHRLEHACGRSGIRLATLAGHYHNRRMTGCERIAQFTADPVAMERVLGFMVWCSGLEDRFIAELLPVLAATRKPVATLNVSSRSAVNAMVAADPRAMLFVPSAGQPGRQVARHLLTLGHRHFAFIHVDPMDDWARERFAAMQREVAAHGGSVTCFPYHKPGWDAVPQGTSGVRKTLRLFVPRYQARRKNPNLARRIETEFGSRLASVLQRQISWQTLEPALEKALARTDITAWVGASDEPAADAVEFLRGKGVAVPGRISVAGFDDSGEASVLKMTSYNFNIETGVEATLAHLLHPGLRRTGARQRRVVELEGFLTVRASTGEARPDAHG
jgi:DNA-binding LacI/PurR family transcriptional regulator/DNA-binding transcriptional regulator YhcF (GntR family)